MPYDHQVSQLLDIGASHTSAEEWPDYLALGLGAEHVPALVDMATDRVLLDDAKPPASWAPIHALRALAQLRAENVAGALVPLFDAYDPEDVGANELATVLEILGPTALPFAAAYLGRREADVYRRGLAAETIAGIGRSHPAARAACVAALAR